MPWPINISPLFCFNLIFDPRSHFEIFFQKKNKKKKRLKDLISKKIFSKQQDLDLI